MNCGQTRRNANAAPRSSRRQIQPRKTAAKSQMSGSIARPSILRRFLAILVLSAKKLLTILLAVGSVTGLCFQFRPSLSIETEGSLNPRDPYSTRFRVTNTGRLTLHNITFDAQLIDTPFMSGIHLRATQSGLSPVQTLTSGESATRNIPISAIGLEGQNDIQISVRFRSLFVYGQREVKARFVTQTDSDGHLRWFHQPAKN